MLILTEILFSLLLLLSGIVVMGSCVLLAVAPFIYIAYRYKVITKGQPIPDQTHTNVGESQQ